MKYGEVIIKCQLSEMGTLFLGMPHSGYKWVAECFRDAIKRKKPFELRKKYRLLAFDRPAKNRTQMMLEYLCQSTWTVASPRCCTGWFTKTMLNKLNIIPEEGAHFWIEVKEVK